MPQVEEALRQGVAGETRGDITPEELHEVVACERLPRFDGEPNQQCKVFPRAERDLLAGASEKMGNSKRVQYHGRRQTGGSNRLGMVQFNALISVLSTRWWLSDWAWFG